jgi:hypothetical protein
VYDDEFTQDTSIDTSLWDLSLTYPGTVYLDSNGLNLQPTAATPDCPGSGQRPCVAGLNSVFSPRFGYWEWSVKWPRGWDGTGDGYHLDTYINNNNNPDRANYQEIGIGETVLGTSNNNLLLFYCCDPNSAGVATVETDVTNNSPVRLSDAFHIIGALWIDDGIGNGLASTYLDGSALFTGGRQGDGWGSGGADIIMNVVSCISSGNLFANGNPCSGSTATSGNPMTYRYFRYWRIVAN